MVSCTIVLHCIKVVTIQILKSIFLFCSNVRLSVGLSNPFKLLWKRLSKICFWSFSRKFFLCSNGNNFSFNGKAQDKVYGYSVSLSVVFLHLAYSERFISWEYSLSWISSGGNFENTHLISLSGYPVWLVVPTKDLPIYNMVCMMFLFKGRKDL